MTIKETKYSKQDIHNKYEKLDEIEKELGVDIVTFFKAIKEGIYVITNNGIKFDDSVIPNYENGGIWYSPYDEEITIYFEDYGKTWALTKEELEINHLNNLQGL